MVTLWDGKSRDNCEDEDLYGAATNRKYKFKNQAHALDNSIVSSNLTFPTTNKRAYKPCIVQKQRLQ